MSTTHAIHANGVIVSRHERDTLLEETKYLVDCEPPVEDRDELFAYRERLSLLVQLLDDLGRWDVKPRDSYTLTVDPAVLRPFLAHERDEARQQEEYDQEHLELAIAGDPGWIHVGMNRQESLAESRRQIAHNHNAAAVCDAVLKRLGEEER